MTYPGRFVRSVERVLDGLVASFTVREVPPDLGSADRSPSSGVLEAGLVLCDAGAVLFLLWSRFLAGPGAEEDGVVFFHLGGIGLSGSRGFRLPWIRPLASGNGPWHEIPEWVVREAPCAGRHDGTVRDATAFLSEMVLEAVSDAWAASLVRRACGMVSPERVAELSREAAVGQVMEG